MQDSDVVSAIVAGDPDGLAEAYDQYAAALYAHCRHMVPEPDAADAVQDTFVIAAERLDGLRDPARLGPWLLAVASNECIRRTPLQEGSEVPEDAALPAGLRERVLAACTDDTPVGRAYRTGVAYRAGAFRGTGFPKSPGLGPHLWRRVQRRPRVAFGVALAVLAAAAAAGTIPVLAFGGPHQARAATSAPDGVISATSASPSLSASAAPGTTRAPGVPGATRAPRATRTPGAPVQASTPGMVLLAPQPAAPSQAPPPSPAPQPPPNPVGYLVAAPSQLIGVPAAKGKTRATFTLTAVGGPVGKFAITVPPEMADRIKVSPSAGSLAPGGQVLVTVTIAGKAPLDADLTVNPGGLAVTVLLAPGGGA